MSKQIWKVEIFVVFCSCSRGVFKWYIWKPIFVIWKYIVATPWCEEGRKMFFSIPFLKIFLDRKKHFFFKVILFYTLDLSEIGYLENTFMLSDSRYPFKITPERGKNLVRNKLLAALLECLYWKRSMPLANLSLCVPIPYLSLTVKHYFVLQNIIVFYGQKICSKRFSRETFFN